MQRLAVAGHPAESRCLLERDAVVSDEAQEVGNPVQAAQALPVVVDREGREHLGQQRRQRQGPRVAAGLPEDDRPFLAVRRNPGRSRAVRHGSHRR